VPAMVFWATRNWVSVGLFSGLGLVSGFIWVGSGRDNSHTKSRFSFWLGFGLGSLWSWVEIWVLLVLFGYLVWARLMSHDE